MRKLACAVVVVVSFAMVSASSATAAKPMPTVDVNGCGTSVPTKTIGVVQSDFNCTASGTLDNKYYGIVVGKGSQLNLNGHTITLVQDENTIAPVMCQNACSVYGGTLTNANAGGGAGIEVRHKGRADIHDVTITNMTVGIEDAAGVVTASRVSITASLAGIWVAKRLVLDHVDVTLPGGDFVAECLGATQPGGRIEGTDVTVTGCRSGAIANGRVTLTNLTATNSHDGVFAGGKLGLTNSSVTGSVRADIISRGKPTLVNSACDHSARLTGKGVGGSWNVCALD